MWPDLEETMETRLRAGAAPTVGGPPMPGAIPLPYALLR